MDISSAKLDLLKLQQRTYLSICIFSKWKHEAPGQLRPDICQQHHVQIDTFSMPVHEHFSPIWSDKYFLNYFIATTTTKTPTTLHRIFATVFLSRFPFLLFCRDSLVISHLKKLAEMHTLWTWKDISFSWSVIYDIVIDYVFSRPSHWNL